MSYLLTVIIPTKNRLHYLKGALNCINSIGSDEIEVIVQDNSDNYEEVRNYINSLENENIKYFYTSGKLSQTENSDLAASHVTGKYVCYIGDDDTICESMLELARCMERYSIDSAVYNVANYNWPDLVAAKSDLTSFVYRKVSQVDIKKMVPMNNFMYSLRHGMLFIKKLPRVYHGIISKRLLEEVKEKSGSYFPGPSPDMANATVCSLYAKNEISINMPMIIDGYGKSSAGGMGQRKLHKGSLKGNFQLRDDVEQLWDEKIPKLWMQDTIWPNSAMKALEACGEIQYKKYMNYCNVYCDTYLHDRNSISEIKNCGISRFDWIKVFWCFLKKCGRKFYSIFEKDHTEAVQVKESISIEKAFEIQNIENARYNLEEIFEKKLSTATLNNTAHN